MTKSLHFCSSAEQVQEEEKEEEEEMEKDDDRAGLDKNNLSFIPRFAPRFLM